jgi:hypothetical protein
METSRINMCKNSVQSGLELSVIWVNRVENNMRNFGVRHFLFFTADFSPLSCIITLFIFSIDFILLKSRDVFAKNHSCM